uniref:TB2/DP1, HVA22 family, putative n=1 Tax=Theileria annulata TaxID=5874 RepID=A0A3B0MPR0_THEAN
MKETKKDEKNSEVKTSFVRRLSSNICTKSCELTKFFELFESYAKNLSLVRLFSEKLRISPGIVLLGLMLLIFMFLVSKLGGSLICDAVGFLYPSYKSYKVLKSCEQKGASTRSNPTKQYETARSVNESEEKEAEGSNSVKKQVPNNVAEETKKDLVYWNKYWIVFSLGFIFNYVANIFLYWLPFYYVLKLVFIVVLLHPKLQGAELIYNFLIAPLLDRYESTIDNTLATLETTADQLFIKYGVAKLSDKLNDYANKHTTM